MEIDHIFIKATDNAPEAELLKNIGLTEGSSNHHAGQGTANRRFFFKNFCLELLFLENIEECQSKTTSQLHLFERLTSNSSEIAPFGICFRPSNTDEPVAPFPCLDYKPDYLPTSLNIGVAPVNPAEPMWFYLSFSKRPDESPAEKRQPLEHRAGINELTGVRLIMPAAKNLSPAAGYASKLHEVTITEGKEYLLELEFDEHAQQKKYDLRPHLPLIMYW